MGSRSSLHRSRRLLMRVFRSDFNGRRETGTGTGDSTSRTGLIAADGVSISVLYDTYAARAYSLAHHMLGGDGRLAEEVVYVVFMSLGRDPSRRNPGACEQARNFLLRDVRRRCLDLRRGRGAIPSPSANANAETREPPSLGRTGFPGANQLREALKTLPSEQQTAIDLAYFEGRTSEEISSQTGGTVPDVYRHLRLGLHGLAAYLKGDDIKEVREG